MTAGSIFVTCLPRVKLTPMGILGEPLQGLLFKLIQQLEWKLILDEVNFEETGN